MESFASIFFTASSEQETLTQNTFAEHPTQSQSKMQWFEILDQGLRIWNPRMHVRIAGLQQCWKYMFSVQSSPHTDESLAGVFSLQITEGFCLKTDATVLHTTLLLRVSLHSGSVHSHFELNSLLRWPVESFLFCLILFSSLPVPNKETQHKKHLQSIHLKANLKCNSSRVQDLRLRTENLCICETHKFAAMLEIHFQCSSGPSQRRILLVLLFLFLYSHNKLQGFTQELQIKQGCTASQCAQPLQMQLHISVFSIKQCLQSNLCCATEFSLEQQLMEKKSTCKL